MASFTATSQKENATVQQLAGRGICLGDALEAYGRALQDGLKNSATTLEFSNKYLTPLTKAKQLSYTEFLNEEYNKPLQPAQLHVVHSWSMRHCDTLLAAAQAVNEFKRGPQPEAKNLLLSTSWHKENNPDNLNVPMFICAYVVNQHTLEQHPPGTPECQIDKFHLVAQKIQRDFGTPMIVAMDEVATAMTQSLCLKEVHSAMKTNMPLKFRGTGVTYLSTEIDAREALAHDDEIKRSIYNEIDDMPGGFEAFNKVVNDAMGELQEENTRVQEAELSRIHRMGDKYLFVGNPGAGKSTILNALVGAPKFKSGYSYGAGLTTVLQAEVANGCIYMDTPGLADDSLKEAAAREITKALRQDGRYRIFFVVTLEGGRVRPADTATIKTILQSAPIENYAVIINKVGPKVIKGLKDPTSGALQEIMAHLMAGFAKHGLPVTDRVYAQVREDELDDEIDFVWTNMPKDFYDFIKAEGVNWSAAASIIRSEIVDNIDVNELSQKVAEQEKLIKEMKADGDALQRELQAQEQELAQQRAKMMRAKEKLKNCPSVRKLLREELK